MEDYDKTLAKNRAKKVLSSLTQTHCKNGVWALEEVESKHPTTVYEFLSKHVSGCKNPRRNGSAYCQTCADAYNAS
jgi:hypothetical protein